MDAPDNLAYQSNHDRLVWDEVPGAEEYQVEVNKEGETGWDVVYSGGIALNCSTSGLDYGTYNAKARTRGGGGGWGDYCTPIQFHKV